MFKFFLLFIEYWHRSIVNASVRGA
jgi:hypothetical protein